jgi:hypothetical protein
MTKRDCKFGGLLLSAKKIASQRATQLKKSATIQIATHYTRYARSRDRFPQKKRVAALGNEFGI